MSAVTLQQPVLDGIRTVNFFNGRLLSGEDLSQEQTANREARHQLGRALGEGIAYGFEVAETPVASTKASPTVTVATGLAINRLGQTLCLANNVDVSLARPAAAASPTSGVFAECQPPQEGAYVAGAGVYLLTVAPAAENQGRAPVSGLGNDMHSCNTRYVAEGVQFRLIQLDVSADDLRDEAHLRNRVAYACFGVTPLPAFYRDPFGPFDPEYGLLAVLRPSPLTDCEVPLAVLYWTAEDGIKFVDTWSVRRRLSEWAAVEHGPPSTAVRRAGDAARWLPLVGDRRVRETEAMFLQFEDQIQDIRASETTLGAVNATQRFSYLPPVGLLPVTGPGSPAGFVPEVFFDGRASKDVALIDGNLLRSLWHDARYHEPIELSISEKIQLYVIWENVQAVKQQQTNQLALVFASRTLSYRGVARFGYADWDLSRFAPSVA